MKILLLGSEGSIGKRYQACLKSLRKRYIPIDIVKNNFGLFPKFLINEEPLAIIIAVPTNRHFSAIKQIIALRNKIKEKTDILCEKPIVEYEDCVALTKLMWGVNQNIKLYTCCNYNFLSSKPYKITLYDYFNHGKERIENNLCQVVWHISPNGEIKTGSPIFQFKTNKMQTVTQKDIDISFVDMLKAFFSGKELMTWKAGIKMIRKSHKYFKEAENNLVKNYSLKTKKPEVDIYA